MVGVGSGVASGLGSRLVCREDTVDLLGWPFALDAVSSVPPFAHDEADLGGEATGGGLFELVYFSSES